MKKTPFLLAATALVAIFAATDISAQSKVASIDMETVVLSHPKETADKAYLTGLMKGFETELAPRREAAKKLADEMEEKLKQVSNEALLESARKSALEQARKIESELRTKEQELREQVAQKQSLLATEEHKLFKIRMDDINAKVEEVAKAEKYDYVFDSSAFRERAPIPFLVYANPKDDITDKVINKLGGTKVNKKEVKE